MNTLKRKKLEFDSIVMKDNNTKPTPKNTLDFCHVRKAIKLFLKKAIFHRIPLIFRGWLVRGKNHIFFCYKK